MGNTLCLADHSVLEYKLNSDYVIFSIFHKKKKLAHFVYIYIVVASFATD